MGHHSNHLYQTSQPGKNKLIFLRKKITALKSIYLHFETPTKPMLAIFSIKTGEKFTLAKIVNKVRARL